MRLGMIYSRVRVDEKMLIESADKRGKKLELLFDDELVFDVHQQDWSFDAILERSISYTRGLYALKFLKYQGVPSINRYEVAVQCGDKTETSILLAKHGVPTPKTLVAFTPESAMKAIHQIGYPCVIKPTLGSWARMVAKITDDTSAEQIIELREQLPNPVQQVYYIQEYVNKTGSSNGSHRDIRAFVVGDEVICAIYRTSPHWITNTAKGGKASNCPVTPELREIALKAAKAVGGGVLAMDLMETPDGFTCHEVNHTMEFKNSVAPTGVDIPGKIIEHLISIAKK
ncbi:MAG TPA: lysine biosynthesis protein LysX [Candidatus Thermoplasmatota archaeon]